MDIAYISSSEFLKSFEWRKLRYEVIKKYNSKCMCCGAKPDDNVYLCVDHIKPRKTHPELALEISNLQVLCNVCNHGKGNWSDTDWRLNEIFIVTKNWIEDHKTPRGGYTKVQINALGIKMVSGWQKSIVGKHITEEQRLAFEQGKFITSKVKAEMNSAKLSNFMEGNTEISRLSNTVSKLQEEVTYLKLEIMKLKEVVDS